jgi:hypothetical protein
MKIQTNLLFKVVLIILVFSGFTNLPVFAQNNSDGWTLYKEVQGVRILYQTDECHDNANGTHYEFVILKFVNTTTTAKHISWSENLYYNGICTNNKENTDYPVKEVNLKAGESVQGDCNDSGDTFRIFSRFLNYADKQILTNYELINIIVTDR